MKVSHFREHWPRFWSPPCLESGPKKLPGAKWIMHLIPTCRPHQRWFILWHVSVTGQGEPVFRRTRRGKPQAPRLSTLVKRRQSQAWQPKEMNQNNYSESFVWRRSRKRLSSFAGSAWVTVEPAGQTSSCRRAGWKPRQFHPPHSLMKSPPCWFSGLSMTHWESFCSASAGRHCLPTSAWL